MIGIVSVLTILVKMVCTNINFGCTLRLQTSFQSHSMELFQMPGHWIRRLHQQSTHIFLRRTLEAGYDITPVQFAALEAIHHHPGADQAQIAERIGYDRATIGGVIERMEKKTWVLRSVKIGRAHV